MAKRAAMLMIAFVGSLILWMLLSSYAPQGAQHNQESNRTLWVERIGLLCVALAAPNPWMGALIALPVIARGALPRGQQEPIYMTAMMWAGLYLALASQATMEWVPWILAAMLTIGVLQGAWAIHSMMVTDRPYERTYRLFGYPITIWEAHKDVGQLTVGQGNPNHGQAVSGIATAAGIGLLYMGYWWMVPAVALSAIVLVHSMCTGDICGSPTAAWGYAFVVLAVTAFVLFPITAFVSLIMLTLAVFVVDDWTGYLSERAVVWPYIVNLSWQRSWVARLIGNGSGAWFRLICNPQERKPFTSIMVQPHSEPLLMLYEHGVLGVMILAGYLLTGFWQAWHAGPAGAAVFLVGAVIVACALISSPWHPYTEIVFMSPDQRTMQVVGQGSPTLNVLSFAAVICLEAIEKGAI